MSAIIKKQEVKIGIVGVKSSGYETAKYLLTANDVERPSITLFDDKPDPEIVSSLKSIDNAIEVYPVNSPELLSQQKYLIVSPGIPTSLPALTHAQKQGVEIFGDIELFARIKNNSRDEIFRNCPVIGITGSNGKTTVTNLTTFILRELGYHVAMAGNVGIPIMAMLKEQYNYYVLELSSYQLETTSNLKLRVGTILNISPDHLDRYKKIEAYIAAKHHIYDLSQSLLYNKIDQNSWPTADNSKKHMTAFSSNPLQHPASYYYDPDQKTLNIPAVYGDDNRITYNKLPAKDFQLQGLHNYDNILAAIALVRLTLQGHSEQQDKLIFEAARKFKGLPHRFDLIHTSNNGVRFINDSKATNIGSVESALRSVDLHNKGKLYLLLGGDAKGQNFTELAPAVSQITNIQVYCYGRDAEEVAKCSPDAHVYKEQSLESVMRHIAPSLNTDDVVLLSPGCASFDQFKNYEHRGEVFTELAKKYQKPSRKKRLWLKFLNLGQNLVHNLIYLGADSKTVNKENTKIKLYDDYLLTLIFCIFGLGIVTVFSSSVYLSLKQTGNIINYKQVLMMLIGITTFLTTLCFKTSLFRTFLPLIILGSIGSLLLVHVAGHSVNGAQRWISFAGFTFQPVELAKLTTLIYLAHYLVSSTKYGKAFELRVMFGFLCFFAIMCLLLLLQPDFGSTLMLIVISTLTILYVTPSPKYILLRMIPILCVLVIVLIVYISHKAYLLDRITGFLDPYADPYGKSYQIINSISAYSHGGFWGVGLGNSLFKSGYLTEANTDYIMAVYGEEFGFFGLIILVCLEILLYLRMFKISHQTYFIYQRPFQAILIFSFVLWFAYQTLYNFAMTAAFLPTDGSTNPLISYGGSSYVIMFVALGITFRTDYENRLLANGHHLKETRTTGMVNAFFDFILSDLFRKKKHISQKKSRTSNPN